MDRSDLPSASPLYRWRFGAVEFDEARQALQVGGSAVEVEQRPLQLLALLLRHAGEVVTKDELFELVWAGRPTVDNVLANAAAKLRRALAADGERIVTLPRVGYRFEGPVERSAAGRRALSRLALAPQQPVPGRESWLLLRQLGPGGQSEVWEARHAKSAERRVFKFCQDGEQLAELKREATLHRLLRAALGERPDFARVLDWNFEQAPFWLECEHGGEDLASWAARDGPLAALDAPARLALFLQIADAVAAAHSVGVLHKDLKPANVLVARREGRDGGAAGTGAWQVRLADFGSGRLLDPERLDALGITRLGLTLTRSADASGGTLLYLAPELLAGQIPTVKSDLYALGLMLYQLLVGDLKRPLAPGWEQGIADPLLCEDIASATDGDPARRLASVADLAERLRSHAARRATRERLREAESRAAAAERALHDARARRPWLLAALATLALGLAASGWFFVRAHRSEQALQRQLRVVEAVNGFMSRDLIGAANPSIAGRSDVSVLDAVRAAAPKIDSVFAAESPDIQAALHRALQEAFAELSDLDASIAEGRKAIAAYEAMTPPDRVGLVEARIRLADDLANQSRVSDAEALLRAIEPELPPLVAARPALQLRYWAAWSNLEGERLAFAAALEYDRRAWALLQQLPDAPAELRERIEFNLADTLRLLGNFRESEALLRDLVARQGIRLGRGHPQTLYSTVALANSLNYQHRFPESEALLPATIDGLVATLGATHRRTLRARDILADAYFMQRKYPDAARAYAEAARLRAERFGGDNLLVITELANAGMALHYGGDAPAAEPVLRRALAAARALHGEPHGQVQMLRYHLADLLLDLKRPAEAAPLLAGLSAETLNAAEQEPDWAGRLALQAGRVELLSGRAAAALPLLAAAEADFKAHNPEQDGRLPARLAEALAATRKAVAAR